MSAANCVIYTDETVLSSHIVFVLVPFQAIAGVIEGFVPLAILTASLCIFCFRYLDIYSKTQSTGFLGESNQAR